MHEMELKYQPCQAFHRCFCMKKRGTIGLRCGHMLESTVFFHFSSSNNERRDNVKKKNIINLNPSGEI